MNRLSAGFHRSALYLLLAPLGVAAPAAAQTPAQMKLAHPPPPASAYALTRDVEYATSGGTSLKMDVFRPAGVAAERAPVLIFSNAAVGEQRLNFFGGFYRAWAEFAASRGVVAVLPDIRFDAYRQDLAAVVAHLAQRGETYGADREAIAIYGASGNASNVLPFVEDPAQTAVKAAVIYYGVGEVKQFRRDLPVLVVRAGLDRPGLNRAISALTSTAISQNAPVTLLNHATGYHGFEHLNQDEATREVMDRTIEFVKRATSKSYHAALQSGLPEATAAGHVASGAFAEAAAAYAPIVARRPDDVRLRLSYAEALLDAGRFAESCAEFEKLRTAPLGARDRGLPAARACLRKGDPELAVGWLKTIPARFLPPSTASDPAFAALADRPDFKALFTRK